MNWNYYLNIAINRLLVVLGVRKNGLIPGVIYHRGTGSRNAVALTFDNGPTKLTLKILRILKKHRIQATFFMVGRNVAINRRIAQVVAKLGHEIGNHTYTHQNLKNATKQVIVEEIIKADKTIEQVVGKRTTLFRPPQFGWNQNVGKATESLGYPVIFCDVYSKDWTNCTAEEIINRVMDNARKNSIILFHDEPPLSLPDQENRLEALSLLIPKLKSEGFEFLTISEIFQRSVNTKPAD